MAKFSGDRLDASKVVRSADLNLISDVCVETFSLNKNHSVYGRQILVAWLVLKSQKSKFPGSA